MGKFFVTAVLIITVVLTLCVFQFSKINVNLFHVVEIHAEK